MDDNTWFIRIKDHDITIDPVVYQDEDQKTKRRHTVIKVTGSALNGSGQTRVNDSTRDPK